jgi:hypothetical protein
MDVGVVLVEITPSQSVVKRGYALHRYSVRKHNDTNDRSWQ